VLTANRSRSPVLDTNTAPGTLVDGDRVLRRLERGLCPLEWEPQLPGMCAASRSLGERAAKPKVFVVNLGRRQS